MVGNVQADNSGDILVEFDYNNIIIVDPNKTIDSTGNIKERLVDHENLVMYANLEVDVMPRTKLLIGSTPQAGIETISIARMNFLKPNGDNFMTVGYYDELTGKNSVEQNAQNQPKKIVNTNSEGTSYTKLTLSNEDSVIDNGLLGITDIQITTNSSFVPSVRIELEDVQGKALFQLGDKSPYATFFTLPYPPFYLTLKGYYGKAIRYQLNLKSFQARFNSGTGNYQVSLEFVGYKFNILTEITMGHLLATPHMYGQTFTVTNNPDQLQTSNTSARFTAGAEESLAGSASNSQDSLVTSIVSERGYQKIREVFSEYKAKGLVPKELPELTLMELLNKIESFQSLITSAYPPVNIEPLTNIRQYKVDLKSYYDAVYGSSNSWFTRFMNPRALVLNDGQLVYAFNKNITLNGINSAIEELKSIIRNNNKTLAENPTLGVQSPNKIENKIKFETIQIEVPPTEISWIKTAARQTGVNVPSEESIRAIKESYNNLYVKGIEIGPDGVSTVKSSFFIFTGEERFAKLMSLMEAEANKKLQAFETSISEELAVQIQDSSLGLGFAPTVRNIIGIIMASAEAFIRLMDEVHVKAWDVKYDPVRKRAIQENVTSAPSTETKNNVQITNQAANENQGLVTAQKPVYPWPQFFVESNDNSKPRFQITYIGDPSVVDLTQGYLYEKWPEVEFVEEYVRGLTQKFNAPKYPDPLETQRDTNQININAIEFPQFGLSYLNKQEVKFFYEIWERQFLTAYYTGLNRAVNGEINEVLNLIVKSEVSNIKNSLGLSSPYLTYKLKNFGFNAENYVEDVLKNFSNQGTGKSYQEFIRDFFVTTYIKSVTEVPFSILTTNQLGKLNQFATPNTALEKLARSSNNTPLIVDTFPFTNSTWVSGNMAGSSTNSGFQVYNTNNTLKVFGPVNVLSNFTDIYNFTENRPVTNFSYLLEKTNPTPSNGNLESFFQNRLPKDLLPTEGLISFISPITSNLVNKTTSLLNSPFFVNAILNGVEKQREKNPNPYIQAAFLFINSLPLASLKEKYKTFQNNTTTDLDYIASVFKKYGAIHKVPYAWVLKIGSIWYRYKKYKETGQDILGDSWDNFDYLNNYSPKLNSVEQTYSFNYNGSPYNITLQKETQETISMNLGFYPKVINDFNYFYNGYDIYVDYTNEEIQKSIDVTRLRIIENKSANIVGANQSSKTLNEILYSVIVPELNLVNQQTNCDVENNSSNLEYYIIPSFGSNVNQAFEECINAKTSTKNTATPFTFNSNIYNGSVRTFWASPNYGYFDVNQIVKPEPDEYFNEFTSSQTQYPFKLLTTNSYSKIEEIFSVFEKSILDEMEKEFLDFTKPSTNTVINTNTVTFNQSNVDNSAIFRNFQDFTKSLMTILPENKNPQNQSEQDYFNNVVNLQLSTITSQIKSFMNYDVILKYGNPSNYRRRTFDSYLSYNSPTRFVVDPITFNPYVQNTLPTASKNLPISQSKALNPEAWLALELEVGFSTIPQLVYTYSGSYITDFFVDNNIEFSQNNVVILAPIIKMYATQKLNGLNATQFKTSLSQYLTNNQEIQNNSLNLILKGLNAELPSQSQVPQGAIQSVSDGKVGKIEIYEILKALNDKWIAGGNFTEKTFFEDMLFLDKASRNIGNKLFLDIFDLKDVLNTDALEESMDVYSFISSILIRNNFTVMNLPAYINFYNIQDIGENTSLSQQGSLEFANDLWGTFLDVDYRKSAQKMVCFYAGKPSEHLEILDSGYRDDGFDWAKVSEVPLIEDSQNKSYSDYAYSNRCVGFSVDIGVRNQNIFNSFSVDQKPGKATSESIATYLDMVNQTTGRNTATQNVSLYNLYKSRSYECTISCLGNALIQPTMYFNLRHVPMFYGPYMITEVQHSIQAGSFMTLFKGIRQSRYDLPAIDNLLQQINSNLLTKIEELFKTRKDQPSIPKTTDAQTANDVNQNASNTIAEQNSCTSKLDVVYTDRQFVSKETVRTQLTAEQFAADISRIIGDDTLMKSSIYTMCYVRTFEKNSNTKNGQFYGYDNNFVTLPLTKNYGDVGFNYFNRTYSCVNTKPNNSEPIANFQNVDEFLIFMKSRLEQNIRRIQSQGILKFYVCSWNGVSEEYYNNNFNEFTELKENFYNGLKSAIEVKLLTEEEARLLGIVINVNEKTAKTTNNNNNTNNTPDQVSDIIKEQADCPPPIITNFYPLSGATGKIIQVNGQNLISTTKIILNNIEIDMASATTQIFNNQTLRFSVPPTQLPLPLVGKIKIITPDGEVTSSVDFTMI